MSGKNPSGLHNTRRSASGRLQNGRQMSKNSTDNTRIGLEDVQSQKVPDALQSLNKINKNKAQKSTTKPDTVQPSNSEVVADVGISHSTTESNVITKEVLMQAIQQITQGQVHLNENLNQAQNSGFHIPYNPVNNSVSNLQLQTSFMPSMYVPNPPQGNAYFASGILFKNFFI